jgi:3-phenylpropionate/cinnamic acid dioxygenase small subunit
MGEKTAMSRDAIAALLYAYAERLDAGDFASVAALFAHATYGAADGPRRQGAAEVLATLERLVKRHDGIPRTKHVITNAIIDVDDDAGTATSRSYFTVFQATPALPLQPIIAGRYHDRFACADGIWRFADRRIFMDLVGDLREHLNPR